MVRKSWTLPVLNKINNDNSDKYPLWGSVRLTYTLCAFCTTLIHIALVNMLALVILRMVRHRPDDILSTPEDTLSTDECGSSLFFNTSLQQAVVETRTGDLDWTRSQEFLFPGLRYYGYVLTLPIAGRLADKFGGKVLFVSSLILQAFTYLLLPPLAHYSFGAAAASLVLSGMFAGLGNPPVYQLFTVWAHPLERTMLLTLGYSGYIVGTMVVYPVANFLCNFSWETPFYVLGGVELLFGICCYWLIYNTLDDHPRLSDAEKQYLRSGQPARENVSNRIPWGSILTSGPVYAFMGTHFLHNYGHILFVQIVPRYLHESMHFTISEIGIVSSSPYLGMLISKVLCLLFSGYIDKYSRSGKVMFRRILYAGCCIVLSCSVIGIIYLSCRQKILVVLLLIVFGMASDLGFNGGYWPTLLYIAPSYAGLLNGITNCLGSTWGFILPYGIAATVKRGTKEEWNVVLISVIFVSSLSAFVFGSFSSTKLQSWDPRSQKPENQIERKSNNTTTTAA